jgi:hypothetical protein
MTPCSCCRGTAVCVEYLEQQTLAGWIVHDKTVGPLCCCVGAPRRHTWISSAFSLLPMPTLNASPQMGLTPPPAHAQQQA